MTIIWSDRAIDRLVAVHDYIAQDSPSQAGKIIKRLFDCVERLRTFPKSGKVVPEYKHLEVREVIEHPYRILYRLSGAGVEIVNVLHSRQQL